MKETIVLQSVTDNTLENCLAGVNINLIVPTNKRMQNKEFQKKGKHLNCKNSSKKNGKKKKKPQEFKSKTKSKEQKF
jgi:hypothetical protein